MKSSAAVTRIGTIVGIVGILLAPQVTGRYYGECELARALANNTFFKNYINEWHCIISGESGRATTAVRKEPGGFKTWGLFQIKDHIWCDPNPYDNLPVGSCPFNNYCIEFLSDDGIEKAQPCVEEIVRLEQLKPPQGNNGLGAWQSYNTYCNLPNITNIAKACGIPSN